MGHEEREKSKEAEIEMNGDVPQEESVEIQSLKSKVTRVTHVSKRRCFGKFLSATRDSSRI